MRKGEECTCSWLCPPSGVFQCERGVPSDESLGVCVLQVRHEPCSAERTSFSGIRNAFAGLASIEVSS